MSMAFKKLPILGPIVGVPPGRNHPDGHGWRPFQQGKYDLQTDWYG